MTVSPMANPAGAPAGDHDVRGLGEAARAARAVGEQDAKRRGGIEVPTRNVLPGRRRWRRRRRRRRRWRPRRRRALKAGDVVRGAREGTTTKRAADAAAADIWLVPVGLAVARAVARGPRRHVRHRNTSARLGHRAHLRTREPVGETVILCPATLPFSVWFSRHRGEGMPAK